MPTFHKSILSPVDSLLCIASHTMKAYFGVEWVNQILECQLTVGAELLIRDHVFLVLNFNLMTSRFDFHRATSSLRVILLRCVWSASSIILYKSERWRHGRRATSVTILAFNEIPMSTHPRTPVRSNKWSIFDQVSYQNEVVLPFLTSILWNSFALSLYFKSFHHIQEPSVVLLFTAQKVSPLRKYDFTQRAKRDRDVVILHMIFRQNATITSFNGRKPSPLLDFNIVIVLHATFARFTLRVGPDQRKAQHKLSISFKHSPGRQKEDIQKLAILISTDLISCSRPAIDRKWFVHKLMRFLIGNQPFPFA